MVRIAVSALHGDGPPELAGQLPVTATLTRRLPDPNGWQVWIAELDWPVRFHVPLDAHRDDPSLTVEFDENGPFLWVRAMAVANSSESFEGKRQLLVHLAYVLNPDRVEDVRSRYIGSVGQAYIDDISASPGPEPEANMLGATTEPTAQFSRSGPPATPVHTPPSLAYDEVDTDLERWVTALAGVATTTPDVIPDRISDAAQRPGYLLDGPSATYYGLFHTAPRTTGDRHELVYWIVEDLAASLARNWATAAPAHQERNPAATHALWLGRWHNLMSALSTDWGERTRAVIEKDFLDAP